MTDSPFHVQNIFKIDNEDARALSSMSTLKAQILWFYCLILRSFVHTLVVVESLLLTLNISMSYLL